MPSGRQPVNSLPRLRLRRGHYGLNAIFFSADPVSAGVATGDVVDVAFHPQINEFRGERSVQLNVVDIRPSCAAPCPVTLSRYRALQDGTITARDAAALLPDRAVLGNVWRYLAAVPGGSLQESPLCLCRKIVRRTGSEMSLETLLTCLDIFRDVGLLNLKRVHLTLAIHLTPKPGKTDLTKSQTMQALLRGKES